MRSLSAAVGWNGRDEPVFQESLSFYDKPAGKSNKERQLVEFVVRF